jgi:hypothetical protein
MMSKKPRIVVAAIVATTALALPSLSGAASTKTCTETGTPHKNFTTTNTQTSACNSNSDVNSSPQTVSNPAGNQPAGQQP